MYTEGEDVRLLPKPSNCLKDNHSSDDASAPSIARDVISCANMELCLLENPEKRARGIERTIHQEARGLREPTIENQTTTTSSLPPKTQISLGNLESPHPQAINMAPTAAMQVVPAPG